ncbi:MAG: hypothetical protein ACJAWL_003237 [Motiliproteus sp.]|jgi:hypothetical protein
MSIRILAGVFFSVMLSGCAGVMHTQNAQEFSGSMHRGDFQAASQFALTESGYDTDKQAVEDLLWALEAGATLSYAGRYELSTKVLDASEKAMKKEDKENLANDAAELALSLMGNDAMMKYEQRQADGVMANTIKAWNFMFEGDYSNARVEWNRAEDRQRRAAEYFSEQIKAHKEELAEEQKEGQKNPSEFVNKTLTSEETSELLVKNGVTFDQWKPYGGYVNPYTTYSYGLNLLVNGSSKSDFNKAADAFERVYGLTESSQVKNDMKIAKAMANGKNAADKMVWVIFENGESMLKEEFRVDLPLFLFSDDVAYSGIALPRLKERGLAYPYIEVNGVKTETISDMDKIIGAEFEKEFPFILAREVSRTLLKTVAQKQLSDKNPYAGLAAGLLQAATTSADTRSFTALPKQFQTAHFKRNGDTVKVKAGAYELPVHLDAEADQHIIYVKATTAAAVPSIRVINL